MGGAQTLSFMRDGSISGLLSDALYRRGSACAIYSTVVSAVATATEP
jgi:hypothetical protein